MLGILVLLVATSQNEVDVVDLELGFTLRLPDGFQDFPAGRSQKGVAHAFVSPMTGDDGDGPIVVLISGLLGALPREIPLPQSHPGGELSTFNVRWKGEFDVPVVTIRQQDQDASVTVMAIQVPISPRAIKIDITADSSREEEMRELVTSIINSLDGQTNWLTNRERKDKFMQATVQVVALIGAAIAVAVLYFRSRTKRSQPIDASSN